MVDIEKLEKFLCKRVTTRRRTYFGQTSDRNLSLLHRMGDNLAHRVQQMYEHPCLYGLDEGVSVDTFRRACNASEVSLAARSELERREKRKEQEKLFKERGIKRPKK